MGHTSEDYCRLCTGTVQLVQGKWKMHILCAIRSGPVRLGRLTRALPKASKKVLTENLRKLERDGLVVRRDFGGTVPHVEYDFRSEMRAAIESMLDPLARFNSEANERF
jgi:DNA-binding HxlR family transcriptional regulator